MPAPPSLVPTCEGLIVHCGAHIRSHKGAHALARRIVRRTLGTGWRIKPLHPRARDFAITPTGKRRTINVSTAWNHVHSLRADRDVAAAEPILNVCGLEPDPRHADRQLTGKHAPRAKSSGGDKHKPGSAWPEWSIQGTHIDKAWALPLPSHGQGKHFGEGVVVGHPDTGYTLHPEIWNNPNGRQRVRSHSGYDFVDNKKFPHDPLSKPHPSHGTKTASVIMSDRRKPGESLWVSGSAPAATLIPYRVIKSVVVVNFKNVAAAILRAVDDGCHVISMSLGGPVHSDALERAVRRAIENDVIVLAAAGNVWPWVVYPARLPQVIAVAASNCDRKPWGSSAKGESVDITAPGESVWRAETLEKTNVPFTLGRGSGTSFAVATAAGVCALWLAYHNRDRLIQKYGKGKLVGVFKELLVCHGVNTPAGWDKDNYGAGIINAEKLLKAPLPDTPPSKGVHAVAKGPRRSTVFTEVADFFPGASPTKLWRALAKELRTREDELTGVLDALGDEFVFHVATNAQLRESIEGRIAGRSPKSSTSGSKNPQLARQASRSLRKQLNL